MKILKIDTRILRNIKNIYAVTIKNIERINAEKNIGRINVEKNIGRINAEKNIGRINAEISGNIVKRDMRKLESNARNNSQVVHEIFQEVLEVLQMKGHCLQV